MAQAMLNIWSEFKTSLEDINHDQCGKEYPDILENLLHFPAFERLPNEFQMDSRYYAEDGDGFYTEKKTWCFLGTIYNDQNAQKPSMRNKVMVYDRDQVCLPIYFYPDPDQHFDFKRLKKGHTIAVLYCHMHAFPDKQIGLRVEDLSTITVLNCTLDQLQALSTHYWSHKDKEKCWACGTTKPLEELKRCGKCEVAKYCSKECQTNDWKNKQHKIWCRAMPEFVKLAGFDYSVYKGTQCF